MKNNIFLIFFFFFSCFSPQIETNETNQINDFISVDLVELSSKDETVQFEFFIKIPTNKLVFNKNLEGFISSLSINLIFIEDTSVILTESWSEEIFKNYFEETKSSDDIIINKIITLPLGEYDITLILNDYENHISWLKNTQIELNNNFYMSNISLFEKNNKEYKNIIDSKIIDIDSIWVQLKFNNVIDDRSDLVLNYDFFYINKEYVNTSRATSVEYSENDIIYKNSLTEEVAKNGTYYYPIKIVDDFFNGLKIEAIYKNNIKDKFIILERDKEISYDFNKVVGPMQYILENSDFKRYREYNKLNESQKIEFIKNYWSINNTNNNESIGELFKEFYMRVEFTNLNFKYLSKEGWDTDRGKIYIIYGKPFSVNNEYTSEGEYQIWTYKNNQQFIFVNRYGTYVLTNYN